MKSNIFHWRSILLAGAMLWGGMMASCSDDEDSVPEGIRPVVTGMTPVENLKPGDVLTISGEHMDQVKVVRFGATYLYERQYFDASSDANKIVLGVPAQAPSGEVYLVSSDETVPNVLAGSIKMKSPVLTEVSPTEVEAGSVITLTGSDLDLVVSVQIGDVVLENPETNETGTELTVTCPDNIGGGILKIVMGNKEEISYATPITLKEPVVMPVITSVTDAYLGSTLTMVGTHLDLVTSVVFADQITVTEFVAQSAYELKVNVPSTATTGEVRLKVVTPDGEVESPEFTIGSVDPAEYVFFDFDGKGIGWKDLGEVVENSELAYDGTKFYEVNETVDGSWKSYFADNSAGRLNLEGVTAEGYCVRFNVNVLEVDAGVYLKFRLGNFWYTWSVGDTYAGTGTNGWTTLTIPLTQFKDGDGNGNSITTADLASVGEWSLNSGWGGGKIHMRIDNVGFDVLPTE